MEGRVVKSINGLFADEDGNIDFTGGGTWPLADVLQESNITDGHNIIISSNDRIISSPSADENQTDVNILFRSGLVYRIDFVPLSDIPSTILTVNPIGGNGVDLVLELNINSTGDLIDIIIRTPGYNYVVGDVVTILQSQSGIPDFTVTITETYGSVINNGEVNWVFKGPAVSGMSPSSLSINEKVQLNGSESVSIYAPSELDINTDTSSISLRENYISLSNTDKIISIGETFIQMIGDVLIQNDIVISEARKITTESELTGIQFGVGSPIDNPEVLVIGSLFDFSTPLLTGVRNNTFMVGNEIISIVENFDTGDKTSMTITENSVEMSTEFSEVSIDNNQIIENVWGNDATSAVTNMTSSQIESIVYSGIVSSSIVQNASNITMTSDQLWLFAGLSGIEMSNTSILNYSTNITNNTDEFKVNDSTGVDTFLQITPDGTLIDVSGSQSFKVVSLPVFADNAAAVTAGLEVDRIYKTPTGEVRVRI